MSALTNFTINEISIGQKASYSKTCSADDITLFASVSGDVNPVHLDDAYAQTTQFGQRIAHGMYTGALVSAALALELPGPGTIYLGQEIKFKAPVFVNDTITVELEVLSIREDKAIVTLSCLCSNQDGKKVAQGTATVMAPREKLAINKPLLPAISIA